MMSIRAIANCSVLILLMSCLGCFPGDSHLDEEKDPHFQRGRNLVSGQDFKGAVDEFEKALETNPRSAAAHFELGWLYDTKINDYAAAIYHYEKHLQLAQDSERVQLVRERIRGCKQELANSEFPLPNSQNLQRQVDSLTAENMSLKQQLEAFKNQASAPSTFVPSAPSVSSPNPPRPVTAPTPGPESSRSKETSATPTSRARYHVVKPRETITSIAAQYHLRAAALLAANPHTDPRHLRVGQSLNLP
jgi:LysM repeat protein